MTIPEPILLLWVRFLADERLTSQEQRLLVEALHADRRLRQSLLDNLQIDGMLGTIDLSRRRGEAFVRMMDECIEAERDATRFVAKVERRLNEPQAPATGRRSKPSTTRIFRRRPSAGTGAETAWKSALLAAGVLAAILLVMAASTRSAPPRPEALIPPRQQRDSKPEPQAPAPPPMRPSERPRIDGEPKIPLVPRQFFESNPEERPAPPPVEPAPPETKVARSMTQPELKPEAPVDPAEVVSLVGAAYFPKSGAGRTPAWKGARVPLEGHVETGPSSYARLLFRDETWVEIGSHTSLRLLPGALGRWVSLDSGALESRIEKQHPDRPMVFATPNAEATVLGTTLRLSFTQNPAPMTTLEVEKGKVRLRRRSDGKFVDVVSGQTAVVAAGNELAAYRTIPDELIIRFGPPGIASDATMWVDSGEEFDSARGYGWAGEKQRKPVAWWQGQPKYEGREAVSRDGPGVDALRSTAVVAGWVNHAETWKLPMPNGRYQITVCCGDATWEQGPHHVWIEGHQVIDGEINRQGEFVERIKLIDVRDGVLNMKVGGYAGKKISTDGSSDTLLNYLIIRPADPRRK